MNIFISILNALGVGYTKNFAEQQFEQHPYKYTMFGMSELLSEYKIDNLGLKITNKDQLLSIATPFVAQVSNDLVVVESVNLEKVIYVWRGRKLSVNTDKFKDIWSGVVLLIEATPSSCEPNYRQHLRHENYIKSEILLFGLVIVVLAAFALYHNQNNLSLMYILLLLVNVIGAYVGYLLFRKQVHAQSQVADKICSLFQKNDCNNILESSASKFMGVIGWSEIGLGYFISNLVIVIFLPGLLPFLAIINILTLPYTLWSVWYQKFKVKQWCSLCIIIQITLWLVFVICGIAGIWQILNLTTLNIATIVSVFLLPLLAINLIVPKLTSRHKVDSLTYELRSLKMREDVFLAILKKQNHHETSKSVSRIQWGDPNAKLRVTIITNPHCNPCAKMHERVEALLENTAGRICVQYVFSSFSDQLNSSGKFLAAVYLNNEHDQHYVRMVYKEWFNLGKLNRDTFFTKYKQDIDLEIVNGQFTKHTQWLDKTNIRSTPTVLVNGYELPNVYQIEDMKYFAELDVE